MEGRPGDQRCRSGHAGEISGQKDNHAAGHAARKLKPASIRPRILLTAPRQAIGERKTATTDIVGTEDAADAILKNELDKVMKKFKTKNPPFFGEYTSARMIIDLGTRHDTPDNPPGPTPPGPK